jgi:hypothetical protein
MARGSNAARALIDRLVFALGFFEQFEIAFDVRASRILAPCRQKRRAGATIVAAQHVGVALVVEKFRGLANDLDGLPVGTVGEIKAA